MSDERPVTIKFEPYLGVLTISIGNQQISIDELPTESEFIQVGDDSDDRRPLWLTDHETEILLKMIEHVLAKLRISDDARTTLTGVMPRAKQLLAQARAESIDERASG